MIYLFFAHHNEARPFIEALKLKKNMQFHRCELFRNDEVTLAISGFGKIKAAIAVTLACGEVLPDSDSKAFNIGISGGSTQFEIGQLFLVNKVTDDGNGRSCYPDLLVEVDLPEASLVTVDKPILDREITSGLIDMEGAGFYEAALRFFSQDRISLLKIVSDHGTGVNIARENVESLMRGQMDHILRIVRA